MDTSLCWVVSLFIVGSASQRSPHWPPVVEGEISSPRDREVQRPKLYPLMLAQAGGGGGVLYLASPCSNPVSVLVFAPWLAPSGPLLSLTLQPGQSTNVSLEPALSMPAGSLVSGRGILVRSSDFITVQLLNPAPLSPASADLLQVRESRDLGTDYWVVTYEDPAVPAPAFLGVVALSPDTHVTVRLPVEEDVTVELDGRKWGSGETIHVDLAALHVLQLQSWGDLSGAFVSSSAPVAVFAGSNSTTLAYSDPSNCSDHVQDQMAPLTTLGRSYLPPLFPGRAATDVLKIVATADDTMVEIDQMTSFMLPRAGSKVQLPVFSDFHRIQTSKPVLVAIFARSGHVGGTELGDPAMAVLPPVGLNSATYSFTVPHVTSALGPTAPPGYTSFHLTVIVDNAHKEALLLDGQPIGGLVWRGDGTTSYVTSSIPVTSDGSTHSIAHAHGAPFQAFLFGAGACAGFSTALWPTPGQPSLVDLTSGGSADVTGTSVCSLTGEAAATAGSDRCRKFRGQKDKQGISGITERLSLTLEQCLKACFRHFDCAGFNFPQNATGPDECHVLLGSVSAVSAPGWVFFRWDQGEATATN